VIVHNGGRVSRRYLQHVGQEWIEEHKEEARLGELLRVDNDYLSQAFDFFELMGSLLCQECWRLFAREEQADRGSAFCAHQYDCLVEAKWTVAEGLGSWSKEGELAEADSLIGRINHWLSIKRQGRWSEIEAEVTTFDYGVLNLRYVAALHALAERRDSFFSVLSDARLLEDELKHWPIFEEMRQDPRFGEFLSKMRSVTESE
jgi:hypothetical protein